MTDFPNTARDAGAYAEMNATTLDRIKVDWLYPIMTAPNGPMADVHALINEIKRLQYQGAAYWKAQFEESRGIVASLRANAANDAATLASRYKAWSEVRAHATKLGAELAKLRSDTDAQRSELQSALADLQAKLAATGAVSSGTAQDAASIPNVEVVESHAPPKVIVNAADAPIVYVYKATSYTHLEPWWRVIFQPDLGTIPRVVAGPCSESEAHIIAFALNTTFRNNDLWEISPQPGRPAARYSGPTGLRGQRF